MKENCAQRNGNGLNNLEHTIDQVCSASLVSPEFVTHIPPSPNYFQNEPEPDSQQYVLYWATQSLRLDSNPCLAFSEHLAKIMGLPVVVLATIDLNVLRRTSLRTIMFILEGLADFQDGLAGKKIPFFLRIDPNDSQKQGSSSIIGHHQSDGAERGTHEKLVRKDFAGFASQARIVVSDERFMPEDIENVRETAKTIACPLITVNSQTLFPISSPNISNEDRSGYLSFVSEFPRLIRKEFSPLQGQLPRIRYTPLPVPDMRWHGPIWEGTETWSASDFAASKNRAQLLAILESQKINTKATPQSTTFRGGERMARRVLANFVPRKIKHYSITLRSEPMIPGLHYRSNLSPYLTFGFTSVATAVGAVLDFETSQNAQMLSRETDGRASTKNNRRSAENAASPRQHPTLYRKRKSSPAACNYNVNMNSEDFLSTIGRREFAYMKAHYDSKHDAYENALPKWLRAWFEDRGSLDPCRERTLDWGLPEWARCESDSSRWNSIMRKIRTRGLCSYPDRLFWCQYLFNSQTRAEDAWETLLEMNDVYMLDAYSPNAVAAIATSLGRYQVPVKYQEPSEEDAPYGQRMYAVGLESLFGPVDGPSLFDPLVGCPLIRNYASEDMNREEDDEDFP